MSSSSVRTAIFPVGGLGTRFLPATKAMPKEMLPIVDKPLIQYAVEEAAKAGIQQFIFVTGRGKSAIENHFDRSVELEYSLQGSQKEELSAALKEIRMPPGCIAYTRQQEPLGLGHAVWCARHLIGDHPFAVLLADDFIHGPLSCLKEMIDHYNSGIMVAVMEVPPHQTHCYGIIEPATQNGPLIDVKSVVEKPSPGQAPSSWAIVGRYILPPQMMDILGKQPKGKGGEIQLTDGLDKWLETGKMTGFQFSGRRFDCGSKAGFISANLQVAMDNPNLREEVLKEIYRHINNTQRP